MKFNLETDSINYIKIVYRNMQNNTCCAKAAIKYIGKKEILAYAKYNETLSLNTPQDISISFIIDNGLFRTNSVLKYINHEPPYTLFAIQTPSVIEYEQNRYYFRVLMETNAILYYKYKDFASQMVCKTHDISANGVRLILPERINEPDNACIDIFFDTKTITAQAKFVRFDNDDDIFKASFCFTNLSEVDRDIISQKCIQKQLEYKRKTFY